MKSRLVVVPTLVVMVWTMLAAGCASNPQTLPRYDMAVDGLARSYHLFVPAEPPEGPMPLVVGFHGGGGAGGSEAKHGLGILLKRDAGEMCSFRSAKV